MTHATPTGVREAHVVVPRGPGNTARLSFDNGLERLDLRARNLAGTLAETDFADPVPVVWASGHNVHVEYPLGARLLRRAKPSSVTIDTGVSWSLDVHGGAAHLTAELADVPVQALSFHSGVVHSRVVLGRPSGRCTIHLSSLKDLRIERPADVPVRLEIAKGATKVDLDDQRFGAVGNGLAAQTNGFDSSPDGYLVVVSGGVDGLTITPGSES
ncbi:MAG: hypothetical protein ACRDPR_21675 [Nocardioidaceae bacterium]